MTNHTDHKYLTASEKAYNVISKNIISGNFKPGMQLSRRKMAEVSGVSVIPVIEALKKLEEDGLVESKPKWGSFVSIPTVEKVKDIYQLREAVECQIARVLSKTITPRQEDILRQLAKSIDEVKYNQESLYLISNNHVEFHTKMAEFTGYESLINGFRRINLFWVLCKAISSTREERQRPQNWHELLLDEICSGDCERADKMTRIHIADSFEPMIKNIQSERGILEEL